jgi:hypothetical protein
MCEVYNKMNKPASLRMRLVNVAHKFAVHTNSDNNNPNPHGTENEAPGEEILCICRHLKRLVLRRWPAGNR